MAASGGFSIDASVRIAARDRAGLERLLRYCARPPFALERLEVASYRELAGTGERIVYRLPRPAPDGTTALSLTPLEFLERLALLIHPPRIHRHRYHGVLAPHAKLRDQDPPALTRGRVRSASVAHPRIPSSHPRMSEWRACTSASSPVARGRFPGCLGSLKADAELG